MSVQPLRKDGDRNPRTAEEAKALSVARLLCRAHGTTSRARSTNPDPAARAARGRGVLCGKFGYSPRDSVDPRFTNPSFGGLHSPIRRARCTSDIVMFFAPITIAIRPVNALVDSSYTA